MFDQSIRGGSLVPAAPPYPGAMVVSARDVARELRRRLPGVGDVKLQKLLYYCQGHHLGVLDEPLFHERISAFDMGPVVGELWYAEKNHVPDPPAVRLGEAQLNTIGYVVSRYGGLSGPELVRLTHGEAPWLEADAERARSGVRSVRIDESALRSHFRGPDDDEPGFDEGEIEEWLGGLQPRQPGRQPIDDPAELERQVKGLQSRRAHPW